MYQYEDLFELVFDNLKRIVFPEEWIAIDIEMPKQELFTIMIIDRFGETTMSQLSDYMSFPMSTATGIIDRLVNKGYLQRSRSESDRRIVVITLSDKGKTFAQNIKSSLLKYIKEVYDSLDEEERHYLFRIINKISAAFQQIKADNDKDMNEQTIVRKIEIE